MSPTAEARSPRLIACVVGTLCACTVLPLAALIAAPWSGASADMVAVYERTAATAFAALLGLLGSTRHTPKQGA